MEEERHTHESFGQIRIGRTHGKSRFYGSELEQDNYITMEISNSEVKRSLTSEYFFPTKLLLRLRMSANQFAEAITSLNMGGGVPVTLEFFNGRIEELPEIESRKEFVHRKFRDRMTSFANTIKANQQSAKEIVKKKTLSKEDIHNLSLQLDFMITEIEKNIPFFIECFQETADEVVKEAKMEVESAIQHKINVLGLQELQNQIEPTVTNGLIRKLLPKNED